MKQSDCLSGKKKYSKKQATQNAKWLKYEKKYSGMVPSAYLCKTCRYWHVGNTEKNKG